MTDRPEPDGGRFDWLNTRVDGQPVRFWILVGLLITAAVIGFGVWWTTRSGSSELGAGGIGGMTADAEAALPPAVTGYYQGEEILFLHTEASDAQVADMLTTMTGSPVLVVPRLAQVPESALAEVYVFTNGIQPEGPAGPFGYQPDIFDSAPGDPAYSPLRRVNLVAWQPGATPRLLRSTDELEAARNAEELTVTQPGVVVNMPMLSWPTGQR